MIVTPQTSHKRIQSGTVINDPDLFPHCLSANIFTYSNLFFFDFNIKFRKTIHEVITLVATTLKALLAVSKTNGRLSRREFYAGNVYYLFLNILIHIFSYRHIKKVRNRSHAPKKHKPLLLRNKPLTNRRIIHIHKAGTCTFYQIHSFADAKR